MPRRFRFTALLALLLVSAMGLGACGGSDSGGSGDSSSGGSGVDAKDLLKSTFAPDHSVKSGNLAVALKLDAKGLPALNGPVELKLNGPFATQGKGKLPQLDLALSFGGAGANFSAGVVSTGDKGWLRLQGSTFAVDGPTFEKFKQGYEQSAAKSGSGGGPTLASLGIDPLRWLKDPTVAGTESIGGAETYHITAGVDVGKFLDDVSALLGKAGRLQGAPARLPSSLTDQQRKDIESSIKDANVEVWTGKSDRTLRRIVLKLDIDVPSDVRGRAGGLSTGTLSFDLAINDLNQPQTITAPTNARPLSELGGVLSGGLSGAAGSGGSAPSTAPPSGSSSKYLTCVKEAGTDVQKIQQCAALAGQ